MAARSEAGLEARRVGEVVVVGWEEREALWVLGAVAPVADVLSAATNIREFRTPGAGPGPMVEGRVTEGPGLQ